MKKLIILSIFTLSTSFLMAQYATKTREGNYVAVNKNLVVKSVDTSSINTHKTFTDFDGTVYTVYKTEIYKLYINKISENGKIERVYLKL